MTLAQLVNRFETVERSIVVVNRTDPDPVHDMLVDTFGRDAVRVVDHRPVGDGGAHPAGDWVSAQPPHGDGVDDVEYTIDVAALRENDAVPFDGARAGDIENLVLLLEDGNVVAGSTLAELTDAVLFVNSDLYVTGTRSLDELELPDVITGLDDTVFTLRGYPESNRQKLLLITISRFIERTAWTAGNGTIRSSFQRLSRIDDELGTRRVYDRITDAGVDAHLYGVPDDPPRDLDATIHGGRSTDFTDSWFVVFEPPGGPGDVAVRSEGAAGRDTPPTNDLERGIESGVGLLAVEVEPRLWRGVWTFDPDRIRTMTRYVRRHL